MYTLFSHPDENEKFR